MGSRCMQSGQIITPSCIFKADDFQQVFPHLHGSDATQLEEVRSSLCPQLIAWGLLLRLTNLQTCGPFSNGAHHSQLQSASPRKTKAIKLLRILFEEIMLWSIMPPLIGMYKCQISPSVMQTPFTTSTFSLDFQPLKIYRAFLLSSIQSIY